jgi:hypothetical protein
MCGSIRTACDAGPHARKRSVMRRGARTAVSGYAQGPPRRCCAAFALGDASSKACPAGYVRLNTSADACKGASAVAGRIYVDRVEQPDPNSGSVSSVALAFSYYPAGCYWHTFNDKVYYNSYTGTIEAETYARPLCAGRPARPHGHTHKHAHTHART